LNWKELEEILDSDEEEECIIEENLEGLRLVFQKEFIQ